MCSDVRRKMQDARFWSRIESCWCKTRARSPPSSIRKGRYIPVTGVQLPRVHMAEIKVIRPSWRQLLKREKLLQLPAAPDGLTAKLIEQAGFPAYQVGGFALDGARFALPDVDLTRFGEKSTAVREIIAASNLPVLVDCDDGYGDVKNV